MVRCLLVNPQMPFNAPIEDSWIKLGLAGLSACLKQHHHEVYLIDFRMTSGWDEVVARVKIIDPEIVYISAFTSESRDAIKVAEVIKQYDRKIPVVVGGIHASIMPEDYTRTGLFDFIIRGEGEITVPKIADSISEYYKSYIHPVVEWGETPQLDLLPFADRELWSDYHERIQHPPPWLKSKPWVDVLMWRGCNSNCRFCSGPGEKNHFTRDRNGTRVPYIRGCSVQNVIEELLELDRKYHYKSIHFDDDQFIMNIPWTWKFLEALKENGLDNKEWWAGTRADILLRNKDLILEMQRCGCSIISVGFESFSDPLLQFWNKGTTVRQNFEAADFLNEHGIKIFSNTIFGAPRSDGKWHIEDDRANIEAIKKIKPAWVSWSSFTAVPGSDLYQWCIDNNFTVAENPGFRDCRGDTIKGISHRKIRMMIDEIPDCRRNWKHRWYDKLMMTIGK